MQVAPVRTTAEPHVRADENAAAVERVARPAAIAAVATRVHSPGPAQGGVAHERGRSRGDSHDLRARDMEVRTEHALRQPDGSLDLLPSYQYALGPDGLPYAVEEGLAPLERPEESPPAVAEMREAEAREADARAAEPTEADPRPAIEIEERAPIDESHGDDDAGERSVAPERRDDHVARSYARLDEPAEPPQLDTVA